MKRALRAYIRPTSSEQLPKMAAMRALARVTTRSLTRRASSAAATTYVEPPPFEQPAKDAPARSTTPTPRHHGPPHGGRGVDKGTARQYCQEKLAPRIVEANRHELVERDIFREMGSPKLLGSAVRLATAVAECRRTPTGSSRTKWKGSTRRTGRCCPWQSSW